MAVVLKGLVGVGCGTTGTSNLVLSSALDGFMTLADAGITNGQEVCYLVKDGNDRELGFGTYNTAGVTISRDTVISSIASGVAGTSTISLSGSSEVYLTIAPSNLQNLIDFSDVLTLPTADGTAGQFLQTDGAGAVTFATQAMVPLASVTPASAASSVFELTGTFNHYRLVIDRFKPATDGAALYLRFSIDGGSTYLSTAAYETAYSLIGSSGDAVAASDGVTLGLGIGNVVDEGYNGTVDIFLGNGTAKNRGVAVGGYCSTSGSLSGLTSIGESNSTTAATDIQLIFSSGNITFGRATLYGVLSA